MINQQMSEGLKNKLLRNKEIYTFCLEELRNENKIYPGHFSYPESLEFSMGFKILRRDNLERLRFVLSNIKRILQMDKGENRGEIYRIKFIKEEKKKREKIRIDSQKKLNKHLKKLKKFAKGIKYETNKTI